MSKKLRVAFFLAATGSALLGCSDPDPDHTGHIHDGGMTGQPSMTPTPDAVAERGTNKRWSDPNTWGGMVPGRDSVVEIPRGATVVLDVDTCVAGVVVNGELAFEDRDTKFCTQYIMVHGKMTIGTEEKPFVHRAEITLIGSNETVNVLDMGTKFIGAMSGGVLDIHGTVPKKTWTVLTAPAKAGDSSIAVEDATGWNVGAEIALASGVVDPEKAETRTIKSKNANTLVLDSPLQFAHAGTLLTIDGRTIDMRTEVGLLSRPIVIQGDTDSLSGQFGGHVMVMFEGKAYVDGIELRRMGQFDHLGRYPFHWHLVGDASGQYLRHSVVNRSLQRGVVVHNTHHALVEDNIVFDSMGHNFLAETPETTDNIYRGNLALGNRIAKHTVQGLIDQHDHAPANFWIRSARNTFENNHAAGSIASGFWYDNTSDGPTVFQGNTGHSSMGEGVGFDFKRDAGLLAQLSLDNKGPLVFKDSVFHTNAISLWPSEMASSYENFIIVANGGGPLVTSEATGEEIRFRNTLFVGALSSQAQATGPAVLIQYGSRVHLENPVFANFGASSPLSTNDIFVPWQAEFFVSGARFIATDKTAFMPPEGGLVVSVDDSLLPRGLYVGEDQKPLVAPGMTMTSLGTPDEHGNFFRGDKPLRFGILRSTFHTDNARLLRSDGFEYADPGVGGFRVIAGEALTYRFVSAPATGVMRIRLDLSLAPGQGATGGAWVDVTLPFATAPKAVDDLGPILDGQTPDDRPAPKPLRAATAAGDLGTEPGKAFFYDATARLLHLRLGDSEIRITP
jgi:G8 domain